MGCHGVFYIIEVDLTKQVILGRKYEEILYQTLLHPIKFDYMINYFISIFIVCLLFSRVFQVTTNCQGDNHHRKNFAPPKYLLYKYEDLV